jgi:tRNA pseudouridine38-40 synthase
MPSSAEGGVEHPQRTHSKVRERGSAGTNARKSRQGADQAGGREAVPERRRYVRYRARVEYDGTDLYGFQAQPGRRTVQGVLEDALHRLGNGVGERVDGAGRTDAGVHAEGQVIAFSYDGRLSATELGRAFDALLPSDVAVRDLRRTTPGFNPRFAARYRDYRYTVWNGPRSPLRERTALGVRVPLDTAAMARVGSVFIGRHDFSAFGATDRSPVRTVTAVRVRRQGRLVTIDVRADAFLRGMVRRMVAVLLEAGLGKIDEAAVRAALAAGGPALDGAAAPAKGLCLRRVALGRRPGEPNGEHEER